MWNQKTKQKFIHLFFDKSNTQKNEELHSNHCIMDCNNFRDSHHSIGYPIGGFDVNRTYYPGFDWMLYKFIFAVEKEREKEILAKRS